MKIMVLSMILFLSGLVHAESLYPDAWVEEMTRMQIGRPGAINDLAQPCLEVVPNGTTLSIGEIFKRLNIDPKKSVFRGHADLNMVRFYDWQISESYVLSIMTAANSAEPGAGNVDVWNLRGYGVRVTKAHGRALPSVGTANETSLV